MRKQTHILRCYLGKVVHQNTSRRYPFLGISRLSLLNPKRRFALSTLNTPEKEMDRYRSLFRSSFEAGVEGRSCGQLVQTFCALAEMSSQGAPSASQTGRGQSDGDWFQNLEAFGVCS